MSVVMRIVSLWIRSMVAIQKPLHFKVAVHNLELPNNIVIYLGYGHICILYKCVTM